MHQLSPSGLRDFGLGFGFLKVSLREIKCKWGQIAVCLLNPLSAVLTYTHICRYVSTPLSAVLTYTYMSWYYQWGNLHKIGSSKDF